MKILFGRHSESVDDVEDRYGGWADFDLTEKGREQLAESAEKIAALDETFEIILSSPLKRAYQAAEILAHQLNLELEVFEYLKERNLNGVLSGMIKEEAREKYPDLVRKLESYEYVDGSERAEDMRSRVRTAAKMLMEMKYGSLIAVTHGLFLQTFFKDMMNVEVKRVGDGGFVLVEVVDGAFDILHSDGVDYE